MAISGMISDNFVYERETREGKQLPQPTTKILTPEKAASAAAFPFPFPLISLRSSSYDTTYLGILQGENHTNTDCRC